MLERGLDALIAKLEKRKLGATEKPQTRPRPATARRTIPAAVRREVWRRDGGKCAFVSEAGRRCQSRTRLEFDHTIPLAHGGRTTVDGIRLLCRTHNQHAAERVFGAEFMEGMRAEARRAASGRTGVAAARADARAAEDRRQTEARQRASEVIPWLRQLGFRKDESNAAAALCEAIPEASLEQRVKRALTYFHRPDRVGIPASRGY